MAIEVDQIYLSMTSPETGEYLTANVYKQTVCCCHTFRNQCRITADKIHTNRCCTSIKRFGYRHKILRCFTRRSTNQSYRSNGNTLIYDRNTKFDTYFVANCNKFSRNPSKFIVYFLTSSFSVVANTIE